MISLNYIPSPLPEWRFPESTALPPAAIVTWHINKNTGKLLLKAVSPDRNQPTEMSSLTIPASRGYGTSFLIHPRGDRKVGYPALNTFQMWPTYPA